MTLKTLRIILAVIVLTSLTIFFTDISGKIPLVFHKLADIQLVPALVAGSVITLIVLTVLTVVCGRLYCSVICPMGLYMDVITWIRKRFRPKLKFSFSPEKRWLRWGTLVIVAGGYLAGLTSLLSLLDPYSIYGRICTHLFKPVYVLLNNGLATVLNPAGDHLLFPVDFVNVSLVSALITLLTGLFITVLSIFFGRTWCNTLCPVGTLLGYTSKLALFKIRFIPEKCTQCGRCSLTCKASCIDSKQQQIDYSRCVACFDCLSICKKGGMAYRLPLQTDRIKETAPVDESRRRFVMALSATSLAIPATMMAKNIETIVGGTPAKSTHPLSPPGSISTAHLLDHCTACHLCVSKCPANILKPATLEYGLGGLMQPLMNFSQGYCLYDCTVCSDICPTDALKPLTLEAKHRLQVGQVVFIKHHCVVYKDETNCGACFGYCPTGAIQMVPYKDGLTIPSVNPDLCVGCGGCEFICPSRPSKAIYVEGNPIHLEATQSENAAETKIEADSFGF